MSEEKKSKRGGAFCCPRKGAGLQTPEPKKEIAWQLYLEDVQRKIICEKAEVGMTALRAMIKVGGWEEKRAKIWEENKAKMLEVHLDHIESRIVRQDKIYRQIEESIEKRLLAILEDQLPTIKLADLMRLIPPIFKDAREVFSMVVAEQERERQKSEGEIDQSKVIGDPELMELFSKYRESQSVFLKALEAKG